MDVYMRRVGSVCVHFLKERFESYKTVTICIQYHNYIHVGQI